VCRRRRGVTLCDDRALSGACHALCHARHRIRFDEGAKDVLHDYRTNRKRSLDHVERRIELHLKPFFGAVPSSMHRCIVFREIQKCEHLRTRDVGVGILIRRSRLRECQRAFGISCDVLANACLGTEAFRELVLCSHREVEGR
jgi:hypothetical protein